MSCFSRFFAFVRQLGLLGLALAGCGQVLIGATPVVRAKVTAAGLPPATAPHQPILALPASGPVVATLSAEALGFTPGSFTWSAVQPAAVAAQHLHAATVAPTLSATSGAQISVTFPARGIYQILLSATDGSQTATHQVWVQVWDRLDGLNPLQQIGRNPGLLPPTSMRQLSPDPGPYQHPRLLFTDADWPELNAKSTASNEVAAALTRLQTALNNNFDKSTAPVGSLRTYASALLAWEDGGFLDATYSSSVETVRVFSERKQVGMDPRNHLPDALLVSAYLVWVRNNPANPAAVSTADQNRLRYLSRVAAAAGRAELTRVRLGLATSATGAPDMAVVFDLLYDWMTAAERTDLRDYLYAIGYGFYNTGGGGLSRTAPTSYVANGDFPNLVDPWILPALVIEGEEADVSPAVVAAQTPIVPAVSGPGAWPNASPASFRNLTRMIRWYSEFFVTPWGSPLHHHAYFEASSGMSGPAMLALARRGQNGFITTNWYQASFHVFNNVNPESPTTPPVLWDHHDGMGFGNGIGGYAGRYLSRYLFPDDALMDHVYPTFRREVSVDFYTALFHIDRPAKTMAQVATEKGISLTNFDPFRGAGTTRNTWGENDLSLYFECRPDVQGHMHAEANNFSLYALGRPWSTPPGYHVTINDASATVLIQNPALASDPGTEGYIGQSPSAATITTTRNQFPTPPGKVVEATDDPAGQWTLFAGDAAAAYNYAFEGGVSSTLDTGRRNQDFYFGEVLSQMYANYNPSTDTATLKVGNLAYNPVAHAFRTVFTARGARPYVLVIDDITTDGSTPRNFRWNLPAFGRNAFNTLRLQSGATATDGVLFHTPDAASGPRLLVRDISEQSTTGQPPIFLDRRVNGDGQPQLDIGFDNNSGLYTSVQSNRLLITRENVVRPQFKVLLFPHQSGENLPLTSWNAEQTIATIDLRNGYTDRLTFDANRPDKRTRIIAYTRTQTGRSAPTLNLPASVVIPASAASLAFTGQPGAAAAFTVTATDDMGAALTPALSSPSGTVFPVGVNTVQVTATDALGQISSGSFTVTVVPSAPQVSVVSATNQPGFAGAIALRWPVVARATAYSVKRATSPGGPYTIVSDRQPASDLDFSESGLSGSSYFYIVTSWLDGLEGAPSAEIPLTPALDTLQAAVVGSGLAASGVHGGGSRYLLTAANGNHGGGSDSVSYAFLPWNGDGSFTVRVASLSAVGVNVSEFLNLGLSLRASTAGNAITYFSGFTTFPHSSSYLQISRGLTGQGATTSSYAVPPNPQRVRPVFWLRAVRSGGTFSAFFSNDGQTWSPTADPVTLANFPASFVAGVALGAQNATVTDAVFDQFVFLGTPVAAVTGNTVLLSWQSSPGLTYNVQRATTAEGPFTTIANGLTSPTHTDPDVSQGTTYFYRVSTSGSEGGASTSPTVSLLFPSAVTAPTNVSLTPSVGQLTLNWTASPPESTPTYRIERATSAGGPFTIIASGLTGTTFTDLGFQNGTTYFYRVVAENGRSTATSTTSSGAGSSGTFIKANNTTALDVALSWSPASVPGPGDAIQWTGTYANGSVSTGGGLNVSQLMLTSPSSAITINAGTGPLVLGSGGVDMSASTQSLTVNAPITLAANQTWSIATGRTLQFSGAFTESGGPRNLALTGSGTLRLSQPFAHTGSTSITSGSPILIFDFAEAAKPFAGPFAGVSTNTLRAQQATSIITLDAIALPPGASVALGTLAGTAGATWVLDGASSAIFSAASNVTGLNLMLRNGQLTYNAVSGNTDATNVRIEGGTFFIPSGIARYQIASDNQTFQLAGGIADLRNATSFGFRIGGTGSAGQGGARHVTATQTGGTLLAAFASLGGTDTTAVRNPSYTISAGTFTLSSGGGLTLGADTAGIGTSTFTLSGTGKLIIPGTLSGAQASARQVFAFTGGTLAAATINATNLRATSNGSPGTFTQSGGTLAPGDDGTAGRTQITGNYSLATDARLTLDLGGTTQANGFQSGSYDLVTVNGTTSLAGNLSVRLLPGFTPSAATTFTVLTSTGTLSGTFANVAFGSTVVTSGGQGTFVVNKSGNNVTLSNYTALTPLQAWRWQHHGIHTNSGNALDTADADNDGTENLLEYATAMNPAIADQPPVNATLSGSVFNVLYTRNKSATDVTFLIEWSNDLITWSTSGVSAPTILHDNGTTQQLQVTVPAGSTTRRFVRLRVTSSP